MTHVTVSMTHVITHNWHQTVNDSRRCVNDSYNKLPMSRIVSRAASQSGLCTECFNRNLQSSFLDSLSFLFKYSFIVCTVLCCHCAAIWCNKLLTNEHVSAIHTESLTNTQLAFHRKRKIMQLWCSQRVITSNSTQTRQNFMVFNGKPLSSKPSPERCIFKQTILTTSRLFMTFDLLTSTSHQFIFVPNGTCVVNLV